MMKSSSPQFITLALFRLCKCSHYCVHSCLCSGFTVAVQFELCHRVTIVSESEGVTQQHVKQPCVNELLMCHVCVCHLVATGGVEHTHTHTARGFLIVLPGVYNRVNSSSVNSS